MVGREGFSIRGAAQAYGLSRDAIADAVKLGQLPAARMGERRLLILRSDLEAWIRSHAIRSTAHSERVVEGRLALEGQERRGAPASAERTPPNHIYRNSHGSLPDAETDAT